MSGLKRVDYYYLIYYMHLAQLNTCNKSRDRACKPAQVSYMYFTSSGCGSHGTGSMPSTATRQSVLGLRNS